MERYIVAIDQSTSASKVFLVDGEGRIARRFSKAHSQFYPRAGWAEHDAEEIWQNVREGLRVVTDGLEPAQLAALAVSNQRETTVLWERATGKPVCPAVVWQDVRAEHLCQTLSEHGDKVQQITGLSLSPYYPAAKAASVLRANPELNARLEHGELCLGTVDSYLVYRLTGGAQYMTDVSNASRTELCDIRVLAWDGSLCDLFGIPMACLPRIAPSDAEFGMVLPDILPGNVPITGVMGDSHAALYGQGCFTPGMTKATFGTGSSVMMNVGERVVSSRSGLSASVGYGYLGKTRYVLEGNVTSSGDALCWLRDEAGLIADIDEAETLAASVPDAGGAYFIPAFSGLGAPYFQGQARAALVGVGRGTTRAHIARAVLESMAYQDADVIDVMARDVGSPPTELRVDGGAVHNKLLMQRLSDLTGCRVLCAAQQELSALGAAYMAGRKVGLYGADIPAARERGAAYEPAIGPDERQKQLTDWREAVARCL